MSECPQDVDGKKVTCSSKSGWLAPKGPVRQVAGGGRRSVVGGRRSAVGGRRSPPPCRFGIRSGAGGHREYSLQFRESRWSETELRRESAGGEPVRIRTRETGHPNGPFASSKSIVGECGARPSNALVSVHVFLAATPPRWESWAREVAGCRCGFRESGDCIPPGREHALLTVATILSTYVFHFGSYV